MKTYIRRLIEEILFVFLRALMKSVPGRADLTALAGRPKTPTQSFRLCLSQALARADNPLNSSFKSYYHPVRGLFNYTDAL